MIFKIQKLVLISKLLKIGIHLYRLLAGEPVKSNHRESDVQTLSILSNTLNKNKRFILIFSRFSTWLLFNHFLWDAFSDFHFMFFYILDYFCLQWNRKRRFYSLDIDWNALWGALIAFYASNKAFRIRLWSGLLISDKRISKFSSKSAFLLVGEVKSGEGFVLVR